MLITNGSKVDDTDGQGRTSLMITSQQGDMHVSEVLIKKQGKLTFEKTKWLDCVTLSSLA